MVLLPPVHRQQFPHCHFATAITTFRRRPKRPPFRGGANGGNACGWLVLCVLSKKAFGLGRSTQHTRETVAVLLTVEWMNGTEDDRLRSAAGANGWSERTPEEER